MSALHQTTLPAAKAGGSASLSLLFRRICAEHGRDTAITCGEQSCTYTELETQADRIAAGLLERGVRPGCIVAIYLERSIDMIAAMLGVIKVGAAYLPLDTAFPAQRVAQTLADACPSAVIGAAEGDLTGLPQTTLYLRVEDLRETRRPCIDMPVSADDAACVLYTCESRGNPRGVVVSQRNVVRLLTSARPWFDLTHDDVWSGLQSFASDLALWEIWGALLTGARLVLVPWATTRDPEALYALVAAERVTILNQTPSTFALLSAEDERSHTTPLALRYILLSGEPLQPGLLRTWFARHPDDAPRLVHMYGHAECAVHATCRRLHAAEAQTEHQALLGEALPDVELHLLDDRMQPVPAGVEGELCIGGAGVALGYLNRPALTADRFVRDQTRSRAAKLFRTGDLARRRPDGGVILLGRRDRQVRLNGFRIEITEIEAALLAHPAVRQAVVASASSDDQPAPRLVAYYVATSELAESELRTWLAERLPQHMQPACLRQLSALPLTLGGKLDHTALPAPPPAPSRSESSAAISQLEELIARAWAKVLGAGSIPVQANFFDLGGTSMLLIAARSAIEHELNRSIPVTVFFEHPTIHSLTRRLALPEVALEEQPQAAENARKQSTTSGRIARRSVA